ncbi:hypothetical protein QTV44_000040 [Vibrio vulnificus]|nr:hypothetical protein [Vibrio vulnificus]
MKNGYTLSAVALSLLMLFPAQAETIRVENTGIGQTLDLAIDQAVRRSIEQVKGVSMDSERLSSTSYQRETGKESQASTRAVTGQRTSSAGDATYRILNEKCSPSECRVRLAVEVDVPDGFERQKKLAALNKNRRTIAVKAFTGPHGSTITRQIEANIVQDRKFKVLQDVDSSNLDYVLEGRVVEARTRKNVVDNSTTIELTGEQIKDVKTYYDSKVIVEYKLIDRVTQQVKWSDKVPTTSSRNNLDLLLDLTAGKIFQQLKDNIYPLVALKTGNELLLNSGGDNIVAGQLYDIFVMGERLTDPYTKETLGYHERKVARVKVSRVNPKVSYVSLVSGSYDEIKEHAIARPVKGQTKPVPKPVKSAKPTAAEENSPTRVTF